MPIVTDKCYKIVCPLCGVAYDDGDRIPIFFDKKDIHDFIVGTFDWSDGESMERAIARHCRIIGCGEEAWDKKHPKKSKKRS